jgi:hypothetical protein
MFGRVFFFFLFDQSFVSTGVCAAWLTIDIYLFSIIIIALLEIFYLGTLLAREMFSTPLLDKEN